MTRRESFNTDIFRAKKILGDNACIEGNNSDQLRDVAARLAMHFDRGRQYDRAVKYYLMDIC